MANSPATCAASRTTARAPIEAMWAGTSAMPMQRMIPMLCLTITDIVTDVVTDIVTDVVTDAPDGGSHDVETGEFAKSAPGYRAWRASQVAA